MQTGFVYSMKYTKRMGFWLRGTVMFLLIVASTQEAHSQFGNTKPFPVPFILDLEIDHYVQQYNKCNAIVQRCKKQLENLLQEKAARRLEQQRRRLPQTDDPNLEQAIESLKKTIAEGNKFLEQFTGFLELKSQERQFFKECYQGTFGTYFGPARTDFKRFDDAAAQVQTKYHALFPGVSFSFQSTPQVLLYPSHKAFTTFTQSSAGTLADHLSGRAAELKLPFILPNTKIYRIRAPATIEENDTPRRTTVIDNFRHEVSHSFLARFVDPSYLSVTTTDTSLLLNEGFAEYIACQFNEGVFFQRMFPLAEELDRISEPEIRQRLLKQNPNDVTGIYSEGLLFVRWLITLPNGLPLFRQLLATAPDQWEALIRSNHEFRGLGRIGFSEYITWRQQQLTECRTRFDAEKAKVQKEAVATITPTPAQPPPAALPPPKVNPPQTASSHTKQPRSPSETFLAAASTGKSDALKQIIAQGGDIDARDPTGTSALACAAAGGHIDCVELLLSNGADFNSRNSEGTTPLMLAAEGGHVAVVKSLLKGGASVNAANKKKFTPLMFAVIGNNVEIVKALLVAGANVNATQENGVSALGFATESGNQEILLLLQSVAIQNQLPAGNAPSR